MQKNLSWHKVIKDLKLKNPNNVTCAYLNINTITNKFDRLIGMTENNIDILCIAETKLDSSYPTSQFSIPGYSAPFRLDGPKVKGASGGLLVYIKEDIPAKVLNRSFDVPSDIQVLPIEVNFRKSKWLIVPVYRPPAKHKVDFNKTLSKLLDHYCGSYHKTLILGDFNMEATDKEMIPLIKDHTLYSLIKDPTCFYTQQGRCIDLMLTNSRHNFMHSKTFDTGESDFHNMIYTMFKTTFVKLPPKIIKYRCYKKFDRSAF